MFRTLARALSVVAVVAAMALSQQLSALALGGLTHVSGKLLTPAGQPAAGVFVCLQTCPAATQTAADGTWSVDVFTGTAGIQYLFVYMDGGTQGVAGTQLGFQGPTLITGDNFNLGQFNLTAAPSGGGGGGTTTCPAMPSAHTGTPTMTVYLPNITKTLGGPQGWYTPFIVQNNGATNTDLEVDFYKFADNSLAARRIVTALKPGTSFADVPNNDCDLTDWTQYSVVVKSFGSNVVAVVNQQQGTGATQEAGSYTGASAGATTVFLPNVVRTFFGWWTPFIIQNLGTMTTTATASFISFDGTKTATIQRTIQPGQSQFIDPNHESALADGTQYAVTVTSSNGQPLSVVVNTQNDAAGTPAPMMYSTNGLISGSTTLYAPYAVKNQPGVGKGMTTVVVQNMSSGNVTPSISFTPMGGGTATTFTAAAAVGANKAWVFDTRYTNGDTTKALCGTTASTGCLADGEYSFTVTAGASIAAQVNLIGDVTADGYTAVSRAASKFFLPNTTRTLGGATGWTTPVVLQSAGATNITLSWYRFSDGGLVTTQQVPMQNGSAVVITPTSVAALADNTQYAVVADGNGANIAAIVRQFNYGGGDGAMTYQGFAQ